MGQYPELSGLLFFSGGILTPKSRSMDIEGVLLDILLAYVLEFGDDPVPIFWLQKAGLQRDASWL